MSEQESPSTFRLVLEPAEVPVAASAVRLLISDEAHQPEIRRLARDVLAELDGAADDSGRLTLELSPQQAKITHSAVRLLLNDLGREEAAELDVVRSVLEKLPAESIVREIQIG